MAHKHKKVARRVQSSTDAHYTLALQACIDTFEADNFRRRLEARMALGQTHNDAFVDMVLEDWEFM